VLLAPRYRYPPVIAVALPPSDPHPLLAQRRRLEGILGELSEQQWHHPSRCEGWSVQDVVTHLTSTNHFWARSIEEGLAGAPTRMLATFDPVASPALMVEHGRGGSVTATFEEFARSNATLGGVVEALTVADWDVIAEAPPGHLPVRQVADHALWDAWVHERDIVLPLGMVPIVDGGEVIDALHYVAALGRAISLCAGSTDTGAVEITVTNPDHRFVVEVVEDQVRVHANPTPRGAPTAQADAVVLIEVLSFRHPGWPPPPAVTWLLAGLGAAFDQPSGG
jgi:uncharacterized protein (TIGR03083 family)